MGYEEAVQSFQLALMESPGNTQINGDLMHARRKLRSDGPAPPPQPKTFAPPARSKDPRNESSCIIEEVEDDNEDAAGSSVGKGPATGYTRVQIEEDSEDDEEEEVPMSKAGFTKVQIEEDSDESEEGEPEREPAAAPACREQPAPSVTGFHKVQIIMTVTAKRKRRVYQESLRL